MNDRVITTFLLSWVVIINISKQRFLDQLEQQGHKVAIVSPNPFTDNRYKDERHWESRYYPLKAFSHNQSLHNMKRPKQISDTRQIGGNHGLMHLIIEI